MDKQLYTHFCVEGHELSDHSAYLSFDDVQIIYDAIINEIDYVSDICVDMFGDTDSSILYELKEIKGILGGLKGADQFSMTPDQIRRIIYSLNSYSSDICSSGVDLHGEILDQIHVDDLGHLLSDMEFHDCLEK